MKPKNTATALEIELLEADWESDERYILDWEGLIAELLQEYLSETNPVLQGQIGCEIHDLKLDVRRIKTRQKETEDKLIDLAAPGWIS